MDSILPSLRYLVPAVVVGALSLVVYRLFLHPLAGFPGPKLAAITRYYEAYYDIVHNGQYTFKIRELHKQYGPIIRISPYELHINDPSYYGNLFQQNGRWNKYGWTYKAFSIPYSLIGSMDHETHKRRRAPLNKFFSKTAAERSYSMVLSKVDRLRQRIDEYIDSNSILDLGPAVSAMSVDVATQYMQGKSYDNLERADFNLPMSRIVPGFGLIWRLTKHITFFGPLSRATPVWVIEKLTSEEDPLNAYAKYLKASIAITKDLIRANESNQQDSTTPETLVDVILNSPQLPPTEKKFWRIYEENMTITGAGFETVSMAIRLIIFYVYSSPEILERLRSELNNLTNSLGVSYEEIPFAQLERLPYLTAVLMEGLRLIPGVATRTARIAPDRNLYYDKWVIPPGTPVGMTTYLMHLDESVYPDAERFNPDRWMESGQVKQAGSTWAPFSRGARICLGMHLAWAELYPTLSMLVRRYDFEFAGTEAVDVDVGSDQFTAGVKRDHGVKVFVKLHQS